MNHHSLKDSRLKVLIRACLSPFTTLQYARAAAGLKPLRSSSLFRSRASADLKPQPNKSFSLTRASAEKEPSSKQSFSDKDELRAFSA